MPTMHAPLLTRAVARLFEAAGTGGEIAQQVAANLVDANLLGHDSHGVGMAPRYVQAIADGGLQANASGSIVLDNGAVQTMDGRRGFGQWVGQDAMQRLAQRARAHGVALLGLYNVHHLGRIGAYAEQLAADGIVSLHLVNVATSRMVVPWGGREARFGTNPICVGVPSPSGQHVILDFATSRVAHGKARVAWLSGERVAGGPALADAEGHLTDDPSVMFTEPRGALLPFGEHKGAGLALVCSLLGGLLAGGRTEQHDPDGSAAIVNGMLSIAIDPRAMGTAHHLRDEIDEFVQWVKASPAPEGGPAVQAPGDPERAKRIARERDGIALDDGTWAQLQEAAQSVGLVPDEVFAAA